MARTTAATRATSSRRWSTRRCQLPNVDEQAAALQEADKLLGEDVAYIPLEIPQFYCLHGSKVTGYIDDASVEQYPDLGPIGVAQ